MNAVQFWNSVDYTIEKLDFELFLLPLKMLVFQFSCYKSMKLNSAIALV